MFKSSQWMEISLKFLFEGRIAGAWGEDAENDGGTICIRAADFITDELSHSKHNLTKRKYEPRDITARQLQYGDLIIEKSGGGDNQPVGRVIIFDLDKTALCSNFLERLRPNRHILYSRFGAYLLYFLWSARRVIPFIKQTTGIQNLDLSEYLSQTVSIPPLTDQRVIADYLDRETAKIDSLIAAKQRLLDLLAEKRRALITHAVTRGLNPHAPLRDSGIEWLGQIPTSWKVDLVKRYFQIDLGKMLNSSEPSENSELKPYLRAANIFWEGVWLDSVKEMMFTNNQISRYRLQKGDLLVTEGGVTVGRSAIWQGEMEDCYYQNSLNRARPKGEVPSKFLYYWLYFLKLNGYIDIVSEKATFGHLTKEKLEALPMTVPPKQQALDIVEFLDSELEKFQQTAEKVEVGISLLQERRTALIAAAVTGQIPLSESS